MTAIQLLACAGMIVGVFLLLGMKPVEFTDSLFGFLLNPKRSLREDIRESSGRKKSGILRRELEEAQNILQMTGRGNRFSIICAVALALFCAGGSIAILLGNFFLAPVMAVGFLFLPFWYVKLTANHYKRDVSAASDVYKRQAVRYAECERRTGIHDRRTKKRVYDHGCVCSRQYSSYVSAESGLV